MGIDITMGRPKISKVVLDVMRQYLLIEDPTEKRVRVKSVRRQIWDLDNDPQGHKTLLSMEPAAWVTNDINKGKGWVINFEESSVFADREGKLLASAIRTGKVLSSSINEVTSYHSWCGYGSASASSPMIF